MTVKFRPKREPPRPGPKRKRGRQMKERWVKDFAAVGAPPADPLAVPGYAMSLLAVALDKLRQDPTIQERDRLREIRTTAKAIRDLMPLERLRQAEKLIRDDTARAGLRPEAAAAAEMTDVPPSIDPAPLATTHRRIGKRQR